MKARDVYENILKWLALKVDNTSAEDQPRLGRVNEGSRAKAEWIPIFCEVNIGGTILATQAPKFNEGDGLMRAMIISRVIEDCDGRSMSAVTQPVG